MTIEKGALRPPKSLADRRLDAIVIASGAAFASIPGVAALTPEQIIAQGTRPGKRVLIVGGDGVGLATAVYLLKSGEHEITIVEESGRLGRDVSPFYLWRYLKLFKEKGVSIMTRATPSNWASDRVSVKSTKGERLIEIDDIIMTLRESREELAEAYHGAAPEVFLIGDARRPRRLHNALHEAYRMGMEI